LGSLCLEFQETFHKNRADIFILDLPHRGLILVCVLVDLLDFLVNGHALVSVLLLQFLNEVEHALLVEFELGAQ